VSAPHGSETVSLLTQGLSKTHDCAALQLNNNPLINQIRMATRPLHTRRPQWEAAMELVFTTVAVIGGMTFSLAIAILVEELIFGKVLCVFFAPRAPQPKTAVQR
jgi:hypothetical protein